MKDVNGIKSATITVQVMQNEEGCAYFARSHQGGGVILKPGDVALTSTCLSGPDGSECGTRIFQAVKVKDPEDGRKTLHSVTGVELAEQFINQEILSTLEQK